MKTISLWQPWASLIGRGKSIETRSWRTAYRGTLAIHAAKRWTAEQRDFAFSDPAYSVLREGGLYPPMRGVAWEMPFGAIVAVAVLTDCLSMSGLRNEFGSGPKYADWVHQINATERAFGNYEVGRYGWFLSEIRILPKPIPCIGRQGLFEVDLPEALR